MVIKRDRALLLSHCSSLVVLLCIILLVLAPTGCYSQDYAAIAANFGSTPTEILSLGGRVDPQCGFIFNNTRLNCDRLIAYANSQQPQQPKEDLSCDCYNFCNAKLTGCYGYGESPPPFTCDSIRSVVAGCQTNGSASTKAPILSPPRNASQPCPPGYMCSNSRQRTCDEIRQIPIELGLGDVHAGMYCPGYGDRSETIYKFCPAGSYCPNSTTKLPCPAGFFCPDKTAFPDIKCSHCSKGATTLKRRPYGYYAAGIAAGIVAVLILLEMLKRYNKELYKKMIELQSRKVDSVREKFNYRHQQRRLQALKPKLKIIEQRLKQTRGAYRADAIRSTTALSTSSTNDKGSKKNGKIHYDARRLFDMIDTDGNGELSYAELDNALELSPVQLKEFMRRMNRAAKVSQESETVARPVFVKYFLRVLEEISHLEPTVLEADQLFDEILETVNTDYDEIPFENFYQSSMTAFLDETLINELIKKFRSCQEQQLFNCDNNNVPDFGEDNGEEDPEMGNSFSHFQERFTEAMRAFGRRGVGTRNDSVNDIIGEEKWDEFQKSDRRASTGQIVSGTDDKNSDDLGRSDSHHRKLTFGRSNMHTKHPPRRISVHRRTEPGDHKPWSLLMPKRRDVITREEFIKWYPQLLMEVTSNLCIHLPSSCLDKETNGIDIAFQNLSLSVKVKEKSIRIVDNVTGRLPAATMTALMGGSGAGKTSLLNALCGRAFYGTVEGNIQINGHKASIEEHAESVGFVPQDDIVYAELTVRENFIFSGRFQLPPDTTPQEIEDLADATMASLGLSRVMHSIVGDVTRRGVSGGEKKRVNIGLELMAKPQILFLDEPTSGLDSNSALLVMESLRRLVQQNGVTVCSVIHQPRKFIFELFESLILLGIGGNMVYHGPVSEVTDYFKRLHYDLPPGESVADWLIDISSGYLEPSIPLDRNTSESKSCRAPSSTVSEDADVSENSIDLDSENSSRLNEVNGTSTSRREANISTSSDTSFGTVENETSNNPAIRRESLYRKWKEYFNGLPDSKKECFSAPEPYALPKKTMKPSFTRQLVHQLHRFVVMAERNWLTKLLDTSVIIGSVLIVSLLDGTAKVTELPGQSIVLYNKIAEPTSVRELVEQFPQVFRPGVQASRFNLQTYALQMGLVLAILIGLNATKIITEKRKEFFREAGSGYNVDAYFCAVNIISTLEHLPQILVSAMFALWLRNSIASWYSFVVNFLLVGWLCMGWGLLIPLLVPEKNVVLITGFFMVFFGLLMCGGIAPVLYKDIYRVDALAVISGLFSPTRYFVESLSVAESRCLPVQSGFTDFGVNFKGEALQAASFHILGLGLNDFGNVTQRSCNGWFWGVLPAFFVGLWVRWVAAGMIHISDRSKQSKKPLLYVFSHSMFATLKATVYVMVLLALLGISIFLILRKASRITADY